MLLFNLQAALGKVNQTGNQDKVEGLFDGLMQVIVCGVSKDVLDTLPYSTTINLIGKLDRNIIISYIKALDVLTVDTTDLHIFLRLYRIR